MATSFTFLDQADEDALHKARLLNYEERPFKRLTKHLLAPDSIVARPLRLPAIPTPDTEEQPVATDPENERLFREDVLLDFANFESSLVRMQFLFNSNAQERERYATEKQRIQVTAQEVRDSTAALRAQLEETQKTLALQKTYDELAETITNNPRLRPRDEQQANLDKLNDEIADLDRESKEYAKTWVERREQFGKIIEEGMQLRRLIRDEKEEVERREGMEGREDHDDGDVASRGRGSAVGTPKPEAGGATPVHPGLEGETSGLAADGLLHPRGRSPLRANSPSQETSTPHAEVDDVNMAEDGEISGEGSEGLADEDEDRGAAERRADSMDIS